MSNDILNKLNEKFCEDLPKHSNDVLNSETKFLEIEYENSKTQGKLDHNSKTISNHNKTQTNAYFFAFLTVGFTALLAAGSLGMLPIGGNILLAIAVGVGLTAIGTIFNQVLAKSQESQVAEAKQKNLKLEQDLADGKETANDMVVEIKIKKDHVERYKNNIQETKGEIEKICRS